MRKQFTFYESFAEAIFRIRKKNDRLAALEAIICYALYEKEVDPDDLPDAAAPVFLLIQPVLDAARVKAEAGRKGGLARSKTEAYGKQSASEGETEYE